MKQKLEQLIRDTLTNLRDSQKLTIDTIPQVIQIDRPRDIEHGDYSSNIALVLAKAARLNPQVLAKMITETLSKSQAIERVEVAGSGFINFFIVPIAEHSIITEILSASEKFGYTDIGQNKKVIVEFVSCNPTGPLHIGHGRNAAYGSVLSNLLEAVGYNVHREYYINDDGRQIDIVAISVWLRYLEELGEKITFPLTCYQGDYIKDIALALVDRYRDRFKRSAKDIYQRIQEDQEPSTSPVNLEKYLDGLIDKVKTLLGDDFNKVSQFGLDSILNDIREDLDEFGIIFDEWFSEKSLVQSGAVEKSLDVLRANNYLYEKDGAVWFRSKQFGDDKDHVVVRSNGTYTYITPDIAYHWNKINRGFEIIVDVLGADHHGYIPRLRAAIQALGLNPEAIHVPLVQFVTLYRDRKQVKMSTRKASFITLRQLRAEVGNDVTKFFYIMRKNDQHIDFDLDLAKSQSSDNPLYYIQYAHARICSVFRQLKERRLSFEQSVGIEALNQLTAESEKILISQLSRYPEIIIYAAKNLEPHRLANYLRDLAHSFHVYYNSEQFIIEETLLRNARLCLIKATKQVIANGLDLLGVSAPEEM